MNIIFLTTNDPLYLPTFFERVLDQCSEAVRAVYIVPPLYKNETAFAAARKYWRTFGLANFVRLGTRVMGAKLKGQSITEMCRKRGVRCETVPDVNAPNFLSQLKVQTPDLLVSVSCPQIFKNALIGLPPKGILNIHGAILPNYRGVMPSFWMLANGETRAGVSIYFVNEKIDAGDLCAQQTFEIFPDESLHEFLQRSKAVAATLLLKVLRQIKKGRIERSSLDLSKGSYYSWPDKAAVERFASSGRRIW